MHYGKFDGSLGPNIRSKYIYQHNISALSNHIYDLKRIKEAMKVKYFSRKTSRFSIKAEIKILWAKVLFATFSASAAEVKSWTFNLIKNLSALNSTALGFHYRSLSHKMGNICLNVWESIRDFLTQFIKTQQKQSNQQVKWIIWPFPDPEGARNVS